MKAKIVATTEPAILFCWSSVIIALPSFVHAGEHLGLFGFANPTLAHRLDDRFAAELIRNSWDLLTEI
jgi:hypothetical protein